MLGGVKEFEKFFKVEIGNKTLDEFRRKYKINGMNSIAKVMPKIESYTGYGIFRISNIDNFNLKFEFELLKNIFFIICPGGGVVVVGAEFYNANYY